MILTVATICRGSTIAKAGNVASVMASSIRLSRSIRLRSNTSRPRVSANRLARPVKAGAAATPSPATARRRGRPPRPRGHRPDRGGPRRSGHPRRDQRSRSDALRTRPFLNAVAPNLRLWARIAPSASRRGFRRTSYRRAYRSICVWIVMGGHRPRRGSCLEGQRRAGNSPSAKPFALIAPAIPARTARPREKFEIRAVAQRLDALIGLVGLAAVLAARRHDQFAHGATAALRVA